MVFRKVGIAVLVKQGAGIRDVKVWIVVNVDVTVGVEDSKLTNGSGRVFGKRRIAGADGARFGVVQGVIGGVGGGVWVGGYVQRPAVGSDGLWRGTGRGR